MLIQTYAINERGCEDITKYYQLEKTYSSSVGPVVNTVNHTI